MQLTKTEEKMLSGEFGAAVELSMKVLTKLGDALEADRMVTVSSVHHLGEYSSLHVAGVKIVERYAELGGKYIVPTTPNPASISLCRCDDYCKEFLVDEEYASWQWRSVRANQKLGIIPIWSCTPYYHCNVPHFGQHVAWTESSAVIFANSVLGAKTNRYTAGVDVAAAIAGRVPKTGMHLKENRRGSILIEVENLQLTEPLDFAVLGYFMGSVAEGNIPVISGIKHANHYCFMHLGAAATGPGGVPLYHVLGITPEARTAEDAFGGEKPEDKVSFGPKEHEETRRNICTSSGGEVNCIVIGCPHAPLNEIADVARLIDGKKIHRNVEFYIQTSKVVEELSRRMGLAQTIEQAGAKFWPDTCLIISTMRRRGFKTLMTPSAKFAYYAPIELKADVILANIKDCVNAAINGKV